MDYANVFIKKIKAGDGACMTLSSLASILTLLPRNVFGCSIRHHSSYSGIKL